MELKEIIESARKAAPNPVILDVIEQLEGFNRAINELQGLTGEERVMFMEKMAPIYDELRSRFMRAVASYGMTIEQFEEFLSNPDNFSPADWSEMQSVKMQIIDHFNMGQGKQSKKMNQNKKV